MKEEKSKKYRLPTIEVYYSEGDQAWIAGFEKTSFTAFSEDSMQGALLEFLTPLAVVLEDGEMLKELIKSAGTLGKEE